MRMLRQALGKMGQATDSTHGALVLYELMNDSNYNGRPALREASRLLKLAASLIDEACE